jgi:iron(III) transport system substrate-binding protein
MKKFLSIIAVLGIVLSLVACTSEEAEPVEPVVEATDKLIVYSPNSEGIINAVIPLFEQKYGVEVELIQAGTGELMTRLQSEASAPYADVMFGGAKSQFASNPDIFQDYVSENDQYVLEAYRNTSGYMTSYVLDGSVLIVNTDLIGDIELNGYADLLNPALKGKIATADPSASSSAFAQLTNALLAMGGYESDEAWAYVKALVEQWDGKIASGSSAVYKSVAAGEMVVGLTYEDPSATLVKDGANVKLVYPEEGAVFLPATMAIVNGAQNIVNAKLFIDFVISEEVQNIFGSTLTNRPVREGAATADYMTPMTDIYVIVEDQDYVSANKAKIVERYTEIFASLQ